jgi:hypothetical protein
MPFCNTIFLYRRTLIPGHLFAKLEGSGLGSLPPLAVHHLVKNMSRYEL